MENNFEQREQLPYDEKGRSPQGVNSNHDGFVDLFDLGSQQDVQNAPGETSSGVSLSGEPEQHARPIDQPVEARPAA